MPLSSSAHVELEAGAWIKDQLEDNTIWDAFLGAIPQEHTLPAYRFSCFQRANQMTNGQIITMSTLRFQVWAVSDDASMHEVSDMAAQMQTALHRQSGVPTGGSMLVLACTYLEPLTMTELDRGKIIRHAGGVFEIVIQVE